MRGGRAKATSEQDLIRNKATVVVTESSKCAKDLPKSEVSQKPAVESNTVDSLLPSSEKSSGKDTGKVSCSNWAICTLLIIQSTDAVLDHALQGKKTDRTPKASRLLSEVGFLIYRVLLPKMS